MQGAEAVLLPTTFLSRQCLAKKRFPKSYRNGFLDYKIRRERTKLEARIMHRAKLAGVNCPLVLEVDIDKCEIIETKLPGKKLSNCISTASESVLENVGKQLARLHLSGISHGDSTTSNFMVNNGEVYVYDFGLSNFNASLEEQAIDLLLFSKSVSPQQFKYFLAGYCRERGEGETQKLLIQVAEIKSRARYVER